MTDNICPKPGCGLEMRRHHGPSFPDFYVCPRNADAHALCAKLAESEAKVKELEAKLAECCYVIRSMTSRAVLDGFESPDELEAWMKNIFNTGYKWLEGNRDLVKKDDEARKKGAEHESTPPSL